MVSEDVYVTPTKDSGAMQRSSEGQFLAFEVYEILAAAYHVVLCCILHNDIKSDIIDDKHMLHSLSGTDRF